MTSYKQTLPKVPNHVFYHSFLTWKKRKCNWIGHINLIPWLRQTKYDLFCNTNLFFFSLGKWSFCDVCLQSHSMSGKKNKPDLDNPMSFYDTTTWPPLVWQYVVENRFSIWMLSKRTRLIELQSHSNYSKL